MSSPVNLESRSRFTSFFRSLTGLVALKRTVMVMPLYVCVVASSHTTSTRETHELQCMQWQKDQSHATAIYWSINNSESITNGMDLWLVVNA